MYDYGAQAFIQKQNIGLLDKFNQALDSIDGNHDDSIKILTDLKYFYTL